MIKSMTRREIQKLFNEYVAPTIKRLERKNSNSEKIEADFYQFENYTTKLIYVVSLLLIAPHLNKSIYDMIEYNIIFESSVDEIDSLKIIDRNGNVITRYKINLLTQHLIYNDTDTGKISIINVQ